MHTLVIVWVELSWVIGDRSTIMVCCCCLIGHRDPASLASSRWFHPAFPGGCMWARWTGRPRRLPTNKLTVMVCCCCCCCCCCLIGHRDPAAFANCNGMQCTRVWILLAMYSVVVCIRVVVNYLPSAKFWHMQRVNLRSKGIFDALARFVIGMAGLRIRLQAESIIGRVAGWDRNDRELSSNLLPEALPKPGSDVSLLRNEKDLLTKLKSFISTQPPTKGH